MKAGRRGVTHCVRQRGVAGYALEGSLTLRVRGEFRFAQGEPNSACAEGGRQALRVRGELVVLLFYKADGATTAPGSTL